MVKLSSVIKPFLTPYPDDDEWDETILNIQLCLNNTLNRAMNSTSAEVLLDYRSGPQNLDIESNLDVT